MGCSSSVAVAPAAATVTTKTIAIHPASPPSKPALPLGIPAPPPPISAPIVAPQIPMGPGPAPITMSQFAYPPALPGEVPPSPGAVSVHSHKGMLFVDPTPAPVLSAPSPRPASSHSAAPAAAEDGGRAASRASAAQMPEAAKSEQCARLEQGILELEGRNISSSYSVAQTRVTHYDRQLAAANDRIRELEAQAMSDYIDVVRHLGPTTETAMAHMTGVLSESFERRQWEYVEALNRLEIAKHEAEKIVAARTQLAMDMQAMWGDMGHLRQMYEELDALLGRHYGAVQPNGCPYTTTEWRLEMESEQYAETITLVARAKCQWDAVFLLLSSAHGYLDDASRHLGGAQIAPSHGPIAAARSLVADAHADLVLSMSYIPVDNLPGLTEEVVNGLEGLTVSLFEHSFGPASLRADLELISRASDAVLTAMQWVGNMIRDVIVPDLQRAEKHYVRKREELMAERRRLITQPNVERTGSMLSVNIAREGDDDGAARPASRLSMMDDVPDMATTRRGSQAQLPPKPTREQLYGDIEGLRRRHAEERAELERATDVNKARQEVALREKLISKRLRRIMVQGEQGGTPKAASKTSVA